jgi:hypothetical protein
MLDIARRLDFTAAPLAEQPSIVRVARRVDARL